MPEEVIPSDISLPVLAKQSVKEMITVETIVHATEEEDEYQWPEKLSDARSVCRLKFFK